MMIFLAWMMMILEEIAHPIMLYLVRLMLSWPEMHFKALAFQVIAEDEKLDDGQKIKAIKLLSSACGKNGMVYGQHLDIENENNEHTTQLDLEQIHHLKTGRLIECSILMGQINSSINLDDQKKLELFSQKIGLAFQIKDDVLDIVGNIEKLGKNKLSRYKK